MCGGRGVILDFIWIVPQRDTNGAMEETGVFWKWSGWDWARVAPGRRRRTIFNLPGRYAAPSLIIWHLQFYLSVEMDRCGVDEVSV